MNALINEVTNDFDKAEKAMLRMVNDQYRKIIYKSQVMANSGATTVNQAIDMAAKDFLKAGINCIQYKNGRRVNIASYAEMAIRTANKRAVLVSEGDARNAYGIHTVRISKYGQCSETCLPWQGKIYVDDVWSGGTKEEAKEKNLPLLSTAMEGGLFHPNCKHRSTTYFYDIMEEMENVDGEVENPLDEQEHRKNHLHIQQQKRLEQGSLDPKNIAEAKARKEQWIEKDEELEYSYTHVNKVKGLGAKTNSHFVNLDGINYEYIKRGKLTDTSHETKMKVLKAYEKRLVELEHERAIIISKNGEVYEVIGNEGRVYPEILGDDVLDGAYVTHNHPRNVTEYTLSKDDIDLLIGKNYSVIRGVDYKYEYQAEKNGEETIPDSDYDNWTEIENYHHANTTQYCLDRKILYWRRKK